MFQNEELKKENIAVRAEVVELQGTLFFSSIRVCFEGNAFILMISRRRIMFSGIRMTVSILWFRI